MSISKTKKSTLIKEFGKNKADSGNSRAQVAILTERISNLTEHMKKHRHDFATQRGLLTMVGRRRNLLNYIRRNDEAGYKTLIQKLGLRR